MCGADILEGSMSRWEGKSLPHGRAGIVTAVRSHEEPCVPVQSTSLVLYARKPPRSWIEGRRRLSRAACRTLGMREEYHFQP